MPSPAQNEPTMEEILASIRKIIANDPADKPAQHAPPANSDDGDVLELTNPIGENHSGNSLSAASHSGRETDITDDIIFETIEEPAMSSATPTAGTARSDDIFSDKTRQAMDNTFAELDKPLDDTPANPVGHNAPSPKMPSGDSVQAVFERAIHTGFEPLLREHLHSNTDVIIERMKPLIREWMDEHFPALLEGAVRNEVARVVKARER